MNTTITITARITAAKGQRDFIKDELLKLIPPTRAEEGCLLYTLHQDKANDHIFFFMESWANRELWKRHLESPHIIENNKITKDAISSIVISEMEPLA